MWYIFPQLAGLGSSDMATYFGIANLEEAQAYLAHPVLGSHLVEISEAFFEIEGKTATEILGTPDDLKLKSCMTLFGHVGSTHTIFWKVLEKYFDGEQDQNTLSRIES